MNALAKEMRQTMQERQGETTPARGTPAWVKAQRKRLGVSQAELAQAMGCIPMTVRRWEWGHVRIPDDRADMLERLDVRHLPPRPYQWSAERIRAERERLGWTQQRLADEIGSSVQAVSAWEQDTRTPNKHYSLALSEVFGSPR